MRSVVDFILLLMKTKRSSQGHIYDLGSSRTKFAFSTKNKHCTIFSHTLIIISSGFSIDFPKDFPDKLIHPLGFPVDHVWNASNTLCTYVHIHILHYIYYTNTKNKAIKRASRASASPDVINAFHSSQIQPLIDWPPAGAVPPDCGQYGCKSFKQGRNLSQMFLQPQSVPARGVEGGGGIFVALYHLRLLPHSSELWY